MSLKVFFAKRDVTFIVLSRRIQNRMSFCTLFTLFKIDERHNKQFSNSSVFSFHLNVYFDIEDKINNNVCCFTRRIVVTKQCPNS